MLPLVKCKKYSIVCVNAISIFFSIIIEAYASKHVFSLEFGTLPNIAEIKKNSSQNGVIDGDLLYSDEILFELNLALHDALVQINEDVITNIDHDLDGLSVYQISPAGNQSNFFLNIGVPQTDHSRHLRLSVENEHKIPVEIEIAFIKGRIAIQPFVIDSKFLDSEKMNVAWYLLDDINGQGTGFGETITVIPNWLYGKWSKDDKIRKVEHINIVNILSKALQHQLLLLSKLNSAEIEKRISCIKESIADVSSSEQESVWAQRIVDINSKQTNFLIIGRWDDFHVDKKRKSSSRSKERSDPYIPYPFETFSIEDSLVLELSEEDCQGSSCEESINEALINTNQASSEICDPQSFHYAAQAYSNYEEQQSTGHPIRYRVPQHRNEHRYQIVERIHKLREDFYRSLVRYNRGNTFLSDSETNRRFSDSLSHTPFQGNPAERKAWKEKFYHYVIKNRIPSELDRKSTHNTLYYIERKLNEVKNRFDSQ